MPAPELEHLVQAALLVATAIYVLAKAKAQRMKRSNDADSHTDEGVRYSHLRSTVLKVDESLKDLRSEFEDFKENTNRELGRLRRARVTRNVD